MPADPGPRPPVELSVILPALDAAATIRAQLEALLAQEWAGAWEIVVADNGSTDGTIDLVEDLSRSARRLRLVDASDRPGAAHARNRGVSAADGQLLAFCDADDVVGPSWLPAIAEALRVHPLVTGPQEHEALNPRWLHGLYGTAPARELQSYAGIFPFGPTANLGMRRELFDALGGFDESLPVGEDIELCLRAWLHGARLGFVSEALVHYRHRAALGAVWRQAVLYGTAHPAIARRLAQADRPTPSRCQGVRRWGWLVRHLPILRSKAGRARWIVVAGGAVGRLRGSLRHRYLSL
jgi:glycosyltransferase involved in cell wall biosynthesis